MRSGECGEGTGESARKKRGLPAASCRGLPQLQGIMDHGGLWAKWKNVGGGKHSSNGGEKEKEKGKWGCKQKVSNRL